MQFPQKLRQALELREMSQLELSRRSRMSPGMISRYLSGDAAPTIPTLMKLAAALEMEAAALLPDSDEIEEERAAC